MHRLLVLSSLTFGLLAAPLLAPQAAHAAPRLVADFTLPDHLGKPWSLADQAASELVVVAFLGTECPLAKLYGPRLQALADEYGPRGVRFVAVDSNSQDSLAEITAYVRRHEVQYPVLKDQANRVADQFGATRTPEVFVLDRSRRVRYQGRVDDQYVVGIQRDEPTREDLRAALDELLAGKEVSQPATKALGCLIGRTRETKEDSQVTYTRDIAPIFQQRCVECHQEGEIGPFPLLTYEQASGWGDMITEVIREQRMPPWHANPDYGHFANDRSMPDDEKQLVYQWVENGCPEGEPSEAIEPTTTAAGWPTAREPDAVTDMADQPFTIPAEGGPSGVPYQYFTRPSGYEEDRWVEAAVVQPGNRQVVHHIIVYADPPGGEDRRGWIFLTAYVPGLRFDPMPTGAAKLVPAGSNFVFEMHYTPIGSEQTDMSRLGVLFAEPQQVSSEVVTCEIGNMRFEIPPGEPEHVVTASSRPLDRATTLLSLSPHMHLRGKAFRYELATPGGAREVLLDVPAYDFNWQTRYVLTEPRELPAGSVIHCRAAFDNSKQNLANPDPSATVRWGDQSWDEMMLGYFDVVLPRDDARRAGSKPVHTGQDLVGMFDLADADHNGGLSVEEATANERLTKHFALIDTSGDKLLQLGEILTAVARYLK
ncbi:thiol-disulfide oxidoreductase [Posidoniimonas polymericola]|uniref:Thiol-disulfide oxidoreductase n=1 Tax=Posidoniimonas polymericola TaxID=2528002 RepID=A0A5C5XTJ4_9BACT|nr:redoxin domain-containing protein [Posidoniimonas polymericola]TWT65901.1 thiol-disulfide oxidoreductase [Posidoniimonas polymericola]